METKKKRITRPSIYQYVLADHVIRQQNEADILTSGQIFKCVYRGFHSRYGQVRNDGARIAVDQHGCD